MKYIMKPSVPKAKRLSILIAVSLQANTTKRN